MLVLALDTATPTVGAAVVDAGGVLGRAVAVAAARHGELLAPLVSRALDEAGVRPRQLDAIAVGVGPGPFTGLRVGVVHARVMALALGIPVHGVCTLDVIARQVAAELPGTAFLVATDARRREVYWRPYDLAGAPAGEPQVAAPNDVPGAGQLPAAGAGAAMYPASFSQPVPPLGPDPAVLGAMVIEAVAAGRPLLTPQPMYLRRPDAVANPTRKRVTPS